jgi:hypothetical protein
LLGDPGAKFLGKNWERQEEREKEQKREKGDSIQEPSWTAEIR